MYFIQNQLMVYKDVIVHCDVITHVIHGINI